MIGIAAAGESGGPWREPEPPLSAAEYRALWGECLDTLAELGEQGDIRLLDTFGLTVHTDPHDSGWLEIYARDFTEALLDMPGSSLLLEIERARLSNRSVR